MLFAFFSIRANEASQDGRLKSDINVTRSAIQVSGFKTRLVVVLISDQSILHAPDLEDRLGSIRRSTSLDPKSLIFMPPMSSQAEIGTFVKEVMTSLQPFCIEYYRDLTKHARRKKARGGPPPSNTAGGGASHSISTSGWNVRYEIKLGVFAEFRQEQDVAERHYAAALEELFSTEGGVLETTANWSPRFDEARALSDSIALRILRCQLWTGQTTGAVRSWQNYKVRMRTLIDRKGKGSNTYGWLAWEARWASIMSQLIQLADVPALGTSSQSGEPFSAVYVPPGNTTASEDRIHPWNLLHHSGYWLRLFAKGVRARFELAKAIPEEDRIPPGQSPASMVASRWKIYDNYLVLDPHEEASWDHPQEIKQVCTRAAEEFEARQQLRMSEQLKFELAEDLVRVGRWSEASELLLSLWENSKWRQDGWTTPFGRLSRLLFDCLNRSKDSARAEIMPIIAWEMLKVLPLKTPQDATDIGNCLDSWDLEISEPLESNASDRICPVVVSFSFKDHESNVGEAQHCQLKLHYDGATVAKPLPLSQLLLKFNEAKTLIIRHDTTGDEPALLSNLEQVQELDSGTIEATADLRLTPQVTRSFQFSMLLREADDWHLSSLTMALAAPKFNLSHELNGDCVRHDNRWHIMKEGSVDSMLLPHDTSMISVLPKPPKCQIILQDLRKCYWTDEHVRLKVCLLNEESEAINGTITASLDVESPEIGWEHGDPDQTITTLASSTAKETILHITAPSEAVKCSLTLDLRYSLASDPSTPLVKSLTEEIPFIPAFETKFTFAPRWHPDIWPSYFDSREGSPEAPTGVMQLWMLSAQIASLADHAIQLHKLELQLNDVQGDSICQVSGSSFEEGSSLEPDDHKSADFELMTQKFTFDDRKPSHVDVSLLATWSLEDGASQSTTTISVPRLTIPTSEPRVLCTIEPGDARGGHVLRYHLENPSTHFLTFALTMQPNVRFAFSGLKYRTLSLAPLSRHSICYNILLHEDVDSEGDGVEGTWISPELQVVDSYYQKSLKIHPGGSGVKLDEAREISVWIGNKSEPV